MLIMSIIRQLGQFRNTHRLILRQWQKETTLTDLGTLLHLLSVKMKYPINYLIESLKGSFL